MAASYKPIKKRKFLVKVEIFSWAHVWMEGCVGKPKGFFTEVKYMSENIWLNPQNKIEAKYIFLSLHHFEWGRWNHKVEESPSLILVVWPELCRNSRSVVFTCLQTFVCWWKEQYLPSSNTISEKHSPRLWN